MIDAKYLGLTANKLAKIASDLDVENAKLREQSERLFDKTLEVATENAKLRVLIVDAVEVAEDYYHCAGVRDDLDAIKDEMRELGIEVRE